MLYSIQQNEPLLNKSWFSDKYCYQKTINISHYTPIVLYIIFNISRTKRCRMRISDSELSEYINHKSQQEVTLQQTSSSQQSDVALNEMLPVEDHQEPVDLAYYYYYQNEAI